MPKSFLRRFWTRTLSKRLPRPVRRSVGRPLEQLEDRTVPAITLSFSSGVATFTGDNANDRLEVQATTTPNEILYNSGGIGLATLSGVNQLIFNAGGGNDTMIVSSVPGTHFAPSGGIEYNAGGQTGDELAMIGGASTWTSAYNPTGVQAGTLAFTNTPGILTQNIAFTGVPTLRNAMQGASLVVTTPTSAADTINVFTGPNLGNIGVVQQGPLLIDGGDRDDTGHGSYSAVAENIWTFTTNQNLEASGWSLNANANIANSTTVPHTSITSNAASNAVNNVDFYEFNVGTAGSVGTFDIDGTTGINSLIAIYDHHGVLVASNDNSSPADAGSGTAADSFLTYTFPVADDYYVVVTRSVSAGVGSLVEGGVLQSTGGVNPGASYTLHVSIENHPLVGGSDTVAEVESNQANALLPAGNRNGWLYIEQGVDFVMDNAFNSAPANTILAIGLGAPGVSQYARSAFDSVVSELGLTASYVSGAAIDTVNFNDYRMIYVPSDLGNTNGGISAPDLLRLNQRATVGTPTQPSIRDYINSGGGIFALTESQSTGVGSGGAYGWLQIPTPFTIATFGAESQPLRKTPAAVAAGLTISDPELSLGVPYHNSFTGPPGFNNLLPFVMDDGADGIVGNANDRVIALGLGAIQNPGLGGAGPSTAITFGVDPVASPQYPTMYVQSTPSLALDGQGLSDRFNIALGTPAISSIAIVDSVAGAGDTAHIYASTGSDTLDVNSGGSKAILWSTGGPVLEPSRTTRISNPSRSTAPDSPATRCRPRPPSSTWRTTSPSRRTPIPPSPCTAGAPRTASATR